MQVGSEAELLNRGRGGTGAEAVSRRCLVHAIGEAVDIVRGALRELPDIRFAFAEKNASHLGFTVDSAGYDRLRPDRVRPRPS